MLSVFSSPVLVAVCAHAPLRQHVDTSRTTAAGRHFSARKHMANSTRSAGNLSSAVSYTAQAVSSGHDQGEVHQIHRRLQRTSVCSAFSCVSAFGPLALQTVNS